MNTQTTIMYKTKAEKFVFERTIDKMMSYIIGTYRSSLQNSPGYETGLYYSTKRKGKNKGQYGYFINGTAVQYLSTFMYDNKMNSCIDLGCGVGHVINILGYFGFNCKGYEIEDELIKESRKIHQSYRSSIIIKKDITKLLKRDLKVGRKKADVLYFWEPMHDDKQCKIFVENLVEQMFIGQHIAYMCSGMTNKLLNEHPKLAKKPHRGSLLIYIKK